MGQITKQQVKVFAMFAAAFIMTGLAYSFSAVGDTAIAVASAFTAFAFVCAMVLETRNS